ncbi:MAG: hypothetical protein K0S33_3517 [Bacteroidetes bacterium]|jgi:lipopolysaccharide transport system ATP-binding protein|nr:hypothetical protein [Bacteroidota bacterium]
MSLVIKVEDLGKLYRLGKVGTGTISHDLNRWFAKMRGKEDPTLKLGSTNDRTQKADSDYVWALKNINFEVNQGDVLGIIGRNGAGKSTLLKILSRTTSPSTGSYKTRGRIASLLEVGTGFHPELSGRENVFLNGAILGMTKQEIKRNFDEIVAFSGVERYIDTPVKRYSSGMYVRLAFAVAAHLEPEILIVDEVLAVGDQEFQDKCIGKMKDVAGQGRTVLFVSHNMVAIKNLCTRGLFMRNGQIEFDGTSQQAIDAYFSSMPKTSEKGIIPDDYPREYNTGKVFMRKIQLMNNADAVIDEVFFESKIKIRMTLFVIEEIKDAVIDVTFTSRDGIQITHSTNLFDDKTFFQLSKGEHEFEITMDNHFQPGNYSITTGVHLENGLTLEYLENIFDFSVLRSAGSDKEDFKYDWAHGWIRVPATWKQLS